MQLICVLRRLAILGRQHVYRGIPTIRRDDLSTRSCLTVEPIGREAVGPDKFIPEVLNTHFGLAGSGTDKCAQIT